MSHRFADARGVTSKPPSRRALSAVLLVTLVALEACDRPGMDKSEGVSQGQHEVPGKAPVLPPGTATYETLTTFTETQYGVRLYPGARLLEGGTWKMTDSLDEGAERLLTAVFHSNDPLDRVAAFYNREFEARETAIFQVPTPNGPKISYTFQIDTQNAANILIQKAEQGVGSVIRISRMGRDSKR